MISEDNYISSDDEENCTIGKLVEHILHTVSLMIKDFNDDTRFGDIMMERFDLFLSELKYVSRRTNLSFEFKDYENTEKYIDWINLSKNTDKIERLKNATELLKIVLNEVSKIPNNITRLDKEMLGNIFLLHTIIGTLDLYYNKIENIAEILTDRQKTLIAERLKQPSIFI